MSYVSVCLVVTSVINPFLLILKSESLSEKDPQKILERIKKNYLFFKKKLCCLQDYVLHRPSPLEDLPRDIKLEIVQYLDIPSAMRLTQANHTWRLLILNNQRRTLKPIWLNTYAIPDHMEHNEAPDWRPLLRERWDVVSGKKYRPVSRKLEKPFHVFLLVTLCGYFIPLLCIVCNLRTYNNQEGILEDAQPFEVSEPAGLTLVYCVLLNIVFGASTALYQTRRIGQDFRRYCSYDDDYEYEEIGWKLVHGDVYATPHNPDIVAAILGIGHGLIVTHGVLYAAQLPWLLWYKSSWLDLNLYLYLLVIVTPTINGLYATKHFNTICRSVTPSYWLVFLTQWMFSVPLLMLLELMSRPTVFSSLFTNVNIPGILGSWLVGTIVSSLVGRIASGKMQCWTPPVRVHTIRRHIPEFGILKSTYFHAAVIAVMAASAFGYITQFDISWIFSSAVFSVPLIVSIAFSVQSVSSVLLYHQLNRENYWWRWSAFFTGGCLPAVVFLMWLVWNWHQITLDEATVWAIFATAFAVVFAAASHDGTSWWLNRMYRSIMID